ncbi:hypothetical protein EMCRGX_G011019 [Ephydatia muelleri]
MPIVKPHPKSGVIEMRLGYSALRPNEYKAIKSILEGKDVFVTLPTGSGKSLCYAIFAFDDMYSHVNSIALIVSPLKALMKDQVPESLLVVEHAHWLDKRCQGSPDQDFRHQKRFQQHT